MPRIGTQTMYGGYVKDSLLNVNESGFRTFTQVMDDGSTEGEFRFRDRRSPDKKAYRTPWMPVANKIYTDRCNEYKDRTGEEFCPPMIVRVRETTLGNNKYNLGKRQRKYYVIQEFYDEPRLIGNRYYTYEPKSWFMKWNETPEAFFKRIYSKRDAKRRHLPPIPDIYQDKIEPKIKVGPRTKRGIVTIEEDVPITEPAPKKGRPLRKSRKQMEEERSQVSAPTSPRVLRPTTTFILDGEIIDTGLPVDMDPVEMMDELLKQESRGDAELLATILSLSKWAYGDLIHEEPDRLIVDPEGTTLDGEIMLRIINDQKPEDLSIPEYLSLIETESYTGPGSYSKFFPSTKTSSTRSSTRSSLRSSLRRSTISPTRSSMKSSPDEEGEDLERFRGEAGQRYLEDVLSKFSQR